MESPSKFNKFLGMIFEDVQKNFETFGVSFEIKHTIGAKINSNKGPDRILRIREHEDYVEILIAPEVSS